MKTQFPAEGQPSTGKFSPLPRKPEVFEAIYRKLKQFYHPRPKESWMAGVQETVSRFGYLPMPWAVAKKTLSPALLFTALETIFRQQGLMHHGRWTFTPDELNPVWRCGYRDPSWLGKEQHKIETLSLGGLGQEQDGESTGNFWQLLLKIVTTPAGSPDKSIVGTTYYLLPPYQRDGAFHSAYCPISTEIDPHLTDRALEEATGLHGEEQFQLFVLLAQMAGHPVLIDLLPQSGRFSKTVFVYPWCFKWLNLKMILANLSEEIAELGRGWPADDEEKIVLPQVVESLQEDLAGLSPELGGENREWRAALRAFYWEQTRQFLCQEKKQGSQSAGVEPRVLLNTLLQSVRQQAQELAAQWGKEFPRALVLFCELNAVMEKRKIFWSNRLQSREEEMKFHLSVLQLIWRTLGRDPRTLTHEKDLADDERDRLVETFKEEGLWPISGGCWNSAGHPIFQRLSPCADWQSAYPIVRHYNYRGRIVDAFAGDMDITTPWYFAFCEEAEEENNLNEPVIDEFVQYCTDLYQRFGPNGFRLDHLDHSADCPLSINEQGNPISYRAPLEVFAQLGRQIRQESDPTFAFLAEYMGWGDRDHPHLYEAYQQHGIYAVISTDVVGEFRGTAGVIVRESNERLAAYNQENVGIPFTTTRILDNHDRSHPDIVRALSDFSGQRALLKWVKCLFLPGGPAAQRPTLYLDGNQTHTPNEHFASTFLGLHALERGEHWEFFARFDALTRFSLQDPTLLQGKARLLPQLPETDDQAHNCISSWLVEPTSANGTPYWVIANEYLDDGLPPVDESPLRLPLPHRLAIDQQLALPSLAGGDGKRLRDWLAHPPTIRWIPFVSSEEVELVRDEDFVVFHHLKPNNFFIYRLRPTEKAIVVAD